MSAAHNKTDGSEKWEQQRIEFYATYDAMTGIRIAATLGGFFGLMVFLVIYKSRSKSVKALKDPKIAEIAAAAVAEEEAEEEERQMAYALEEALSARFSLGGPSPWPHRGPRFSSVGGGYSSLLAPPRRLTKMRGDSLPGSALRFDCRPPYFEDDIEMTEAVDDSSCTVPSEYVNQFLSVPGGSRRYSSITCSSSGSSYLERRGSSIVCALPTVPPAPAPLHLRVPRPRPIKRGTLHETECRDVFNPINIQVIQATPELSPCVSEHTILKCEPAGKKRFESAGSGNGVEPRGLAPLASLGSCGVSLSVDYQDYDLHSVGSDSVFFDEDDCLDTDDEIEQFSTDSDESISFNHRGYPSEECKELRPRRRSRHIVGKSIPVASSPPLSMNTMLMPRCPGSPSVVRKHRSFLSTPLTRAALRRLSHPTVLSRRGCATISAAVGEACVPLNSQDVELGCRPRGAPLASTGSVDYTARSPSPLNPEHCSWSQETLF